jgi:hypothetical protein
METIRSLIDLGVFEELSYGQKEYENKGILDKGNVPLISGKGTDNGCYGFYNIKPTINTLAITIARTGSVGEAFVQDFPCGVGSDCLILKPKQNLHIDYLYYVVSVIKKQKWRYNFGRKITPKRLETIELIRPDEFIEKSNYVNLNRKLYPLKNKVEKIHKEGEFKEVYLSEIFNLERGQFHALDRLDTGKYPTISRTEEDNGLVGFYDKPPEARVYSKFIITVSTVTGGAFLQLVPFIATDNVVICIPKKPLKLTSLVFIQAAINKVKWRYSYGRQSYKTALSKEKISLPILENNELNEEYMEETVKNQPYWEEFNKRIISKL